MIDQQVLDFLNERWRRPLDITTISQAQQALGLPEDDDQRWNIFERLRRERDHMADKKRYGVSAITVTLTNEEKLAGRALLIGRTEDEAQQTSGIPYEKWDIAKQALARAGLTTQSAWRVADGHDQLLQGVGLYFHTVRARGEVFNVP